MSKSPNEVNREHSERDLALELAILNCTTRYFATRDWTTREQIGRERDRLREERRAHFERWSRAYDHALALQPASEAL